MRRRVVITGMGCVTPLGAEVEILWDRLTAGRSGAGPITLFDASTFPVRIAAEVRDWDLTAFGAEAECWGGHARQTQFAVASSIQAAVMAGLDYSTGDPTRRGVYLGCGEMFPNFAEFGELIGASCGDGQFHAGKFVKASLHAPPAGVESAYEPATACTALAGLFDAQGICANSTASCASSSQAIGEAAEAIRRGDADLMLAGGAHSMIHPLGVMGFHQLSTLSTNNERPQEASRPFDRERDGFVVGEGGAVFVLEALEHALSRNAEILGELTGYGSAQDAFRVTDSHPEGRGAASCIARALSDAQLCAEDVDYVNAHGTGTIVNDKVETAAIKRVFGARAHDTPISSTKSMLGHFTTAGGAIELAICLMVLRTGVVPPTINYSHPDPQCDLDYVPNTAREVECRHVLSNSFGLGGQNVALVVSRYEP